MNTFYSRSGAWLLTAVLAATGTCARAENPNGVGPQAAASSISHFKVADSLEVALFASEPLLRNPTDMDIDALGRVWVTEGVNCDMKLHSVLLGGAILTKPCVCPQVLHGSMRLLGCPEVGATVRGMKPSR